MNFKDNMEYNTTRGPLAIREYGRNIQKMVNFVQTITDREKRNQQARVIVDIMALLNPHLKNTEDFRHMLWDHLFVISDFQLDIDSPFPKPLKENYKARPAPLPYPNRQPKYAHLGKNIETVIVKAMNEENEEKKKEFADSITYYMKLIYSNWHKENMHDDSIKSELNTITGGALNIGEAPSLQQRSLVLEREEAYGSGSASIGKRPQIPSRAPILRDRRPTQPFKHNKDNRPQNRFSPFNGQRSESRYPPPMGKDPKKRF